jgi:hypothetical protein
MPMTDAEYKELEKWYFSLDYYYSQLDRIKTKHEWHFDDKKEGKNGDDRSIETVRSDS